MGLVDFMKGLAGGSRQSSNPLTAVDRTFVDTAYWLLLGRAADEPTKHHFTRLLELGQARSHILLALISSTEFRLRVIDVRDDLRARAADAALDASLATLGEAQPFIEACYTCLLGRDADPEGLAFYVGVIGTTGSRVTVIKNLLRSEEFAERYAALCPTGGVLPRDVQLCELANPAKWDNPEWLAVLRELQIPADHKLAMHRKAYEFTQTIWGLRRLGRLGQASSVLSVGAGHESLVYWLANQVGRVIATDLYQGIWASSGAIEGDLRVLTHPEEFAPFTYRRERLRFLQMNGCALGFRTDTFDIVYSLSSIEHFGGWEGSRQAVEEMARVLKPGGMLALATDWAVAGIPRHEVFRPEEFRALIDVPGLSLVEPIDDRVWRRYETVPVDLQRNPFETPHLLVEDTGTTFTSVFVFLEKGAGH